ncbi:MAG: hypothetical protein AAGF94_02805 [Pseudomonadota bacterium]
MKVLFAALALSVGLLTGAAQAVTLQKDVVITPGFSGFLFDTLDFAPGTNLDGVRFDYVLTDGQPANLRAGRSFASVSSATIISRLENFGSAPPPPGGNYITDITLELLNEANQVVASSFFPNRTIGTQGGAVSLRAPLGTKFTAAAVRFGSTLMNVGIRSSGSPSVSLSVDSVNTPIPLPAPALMLLGGLGGLFALRRFSRAKGA